MQVGGRADLLGSEQSEPAAFDHRRSAQADVGGLGRDDHVGAAQQRRVAGKAAAMHHADHRHLARQRSELAEGVVVQPGNDRHVDIAWPPTPALGEQHGGQLPLVGQAQQAVLLVVVAPALGAGQHGVVVGHHRAATALGAEVGAVDRAYAGDHAVGRGVSHQVV